MRVADVMTSRVVTVTPGTPILAAARLMLAHKISGLPVLDDDGRVVGIVTEHDLLRRRRDSDGDQRGGLAQRPHWLEAMIEPAVLTDHAVRFHDRKVEEVMTRGPLTVRADASLTEACRLIEEHGIKRLPVTENGVLVGIIARADLVRALAQSVEKARAAIARDVSIDARTAELERQIWRDRARLSKPF